MSTYLLLSHTFKKKYNYRLLAENPGTSLRKSKRDISVSLNWPFLGLPSNRTKQFSCVEVRNNIVHLIQAGKKITNGKTIEGNGKPTKDIINITIKN